jgi:CRISPR/Cas system CSM-associated protein Csm4 (group 5 of RAMP superfamily)
MFFSTIDEADNSVSEANKIKRIIYKESMTFKEWNNALEQRKLNCKKNRKILS